LCGILSHDFGDDSLAAGGFVAHSLQVVNALEYLHSEMRVIHRDVKPSNILLNRAGDIKLCDYSISGYLINSLAMSMGVGFYPYMAVSPLLSFWLKFLFLALFCFW